MSCPIYGRERVQYNWSVVDNYSTVVAGTLDWLITDKLLDNSDNTTELTDNPINDPQTKIYESAGIKNVSTSVQFDDGWGNVYDHSTVLVVEAEVYEEPALEFSWLPVEPTILEEVTFTQGHDDIRDDSIPKQYGRIDKVSIDYYNDGSKEEADKTDSYEFKNTFTVKQDGIVNRMEVEYWDGWETQITYVDRVMDMSNIPPVSDHTRVDSGVCIPAYDWTAQSSDTDDGVAILSYSWRLYKDNAGVWDEIDSNTGITYTYPFQFEGDYKLVLRTTDGEGDWHEKIEEFPIVFGSCGNEVVPECPDCLECPPGDQVIERVFVAINNETLGGIEVQDFEANIALSEFTGDIEDNNFESDQDEFTSSVENIDV